MAAMLKRVFAIAHLVVELSFLKVCRAEEDFVIRIVVVEPRLSFHAQRVDRIEDQLGGDFALANPFKEPRGLEELQQRVDAAPAVHPIRDVPHEGANQDSLVQIRGVRVGDVDHSPRKFAVRFVFLAASSAVPVYFLF